MDHEFKAALERRLRIFASTGVMPLCDIEPIYSDIRSLSPLFVKAAEQLYGKSEYATQALFLQALYDDSLAYDVEGKAGVTSVMNSVGRLISSYEYDEATGLDSTGDVMVITHYPFMVARSQGKEQVHDLRPMSREMLSFFRTCAEQAGFSESDVSSWYMTSVVRFTQANVDGTIPSTWVKQCHPWLLQEIAIRKPKYIVCCGVGVLKSLLGPRAKMKDSVGRLIDHTIEISPDITWSGQLIAVPAVAVAPDLDSQPAFRRQLKLMYRGINGLKNSRDNCKHEVITTKERLAEVIASIKSDAKIAPRCRIIAIDLEWEGAYPSQKGAYVISLQFSHRPGYAYLVSFRETENGFKDGKETAVELLKGLLQPSEEWKPRLGGHFLRADIPWLFSLGFDKDKIEEAYAPADTWQRCKTEGGWDTGLMYHAYRDDEETKDGYGLKALAIKECDIHKWDTELSVFLDKYCEYRKREALHGARLDRKGQLLEGFEEEYKPFTGLTGFGCVPDDILLPYALWDADATRRLAELCMFGDGSRKAFLDEDGYGNSSWEPFWRAHRASNGFGEMEQTGFHLDLERLQKLSICLRDARDVLNEQLRDEINWPDFNINSAFHKRGLLFGRSFVNTDSKLIVPEEAVTYDLMPIRSTDKTDWEDIDEEDIDAYSPSTDGLSLKILSQKHPEVRLLKDLCKLDRTLKGNIREPIEKPDGTCTWDAGIFTYMREDGTVHTRLSQTKKTGRASSSSPPMQNMGKSAEALLQTILGYKDGSEVVMPAYPVLGEPQYLYPCRTILKAAPGCILVESDYTGAELAVMAWVSGDPSMIEHVRRNALPEDDPDYYDIHSHIAVKAFKLDCPPTKSGLKSIGKKHLRVAAKAVVFGIPYGRGVRAILLQCQGEGVYLTEPEGEDLVNTYFELYPRTKKFLYQCGVDVEQKHFVKTLFNRIRRFSVNAPAHKLPKFKREACNSPIQGTVADSNNNAIYNLLKYRKEHPDVDFRLVMQVHDSLVTQWPIEYARKAKDVLKQCMVTDNPVVVNGVSHYYGLDSDYYVNWGEPLTESVAIREFGKSLKEII